ncbi:fibroblast growth factor-binding protein 1-like [Narcine bancroftii]|uniref:fibroblast growth factor-binding protein 1-like n=1 Tax=Narcine bancroftii TaxID=1343680 RepID=UPI0038315938
MKLARVGLLLLLLFVAQCLLADARDDQKSKRRRKGDSPGGDGKEKRQSKRRNSAPRQGKFVGNNKAECRWTLRGEETGERNLRLGCKDGHHDYWCEFTGNPAACQKYAGNVRTYWKQVARALKKKTPDCSDPSTVLRASLCKSTKEAQMKLSRSSLLPAAEKDSQGPAPLTTVDPDNLDIDKLAAENCSERWGSLCKFMLSVFEG